MLSVWPYRQNQIRIPNNNNYVWDIHTREHYICIRDERYRHKCCQVIRQISTLTHTSFIHLPCPLTILLLFWCDVIVTHHMWVPRDDTIKIDEVAFVKKHVQFTPYFLQCTEANPRNVIRYGFIPVLSTYFELSFAVYVYKYIYEYIDWANSLFPIIISPNWDSDARKSTQTPNKHDFAWLSLYVRFVSN